MPIITIRGQLGSGAPQIGRKIADAFHIDYMDREIINRIAERLKIPRNKVIAKEILPLKLTDRIARFIENDFVVAGPLSQPSPDEDIPPLDNTHYKKVLRSIITHLARNGSVVISGRGSQFILQDYPGVLHILVVAPLELRVKRVMESFGLNEKAAGAIIVRYDGNRREFIKKYFKADLEDSLHYDLTINTAHISYESAIALIIRANSLKDRISNTI
jgi:cytidylate kinase